MVFWFFFGYLALAVAFYIIVIATASQSPLLALLRPSKWLRPRKVKPAELFRRLRKK